MQYKFYLNNLRIAPRKTRLIANLIKKMPALQAEAQLKFQKRRAALPILKLLKSGVASAIHNFNLSPENLYVLNIFVDEGPMLKRFRPRAFGRSGAIHKKTSHITLILEEKASTEKKKRKFAKAKIVKEKETSEIKERTEIGISQMPKKEMIKEIKPTRKTGGFARRIFRRKAIG